MGYNGVLLVVVPSVLLFLTKLTFGIVLDIRGYIQPVTVWVRFEPMNWWCLTRWLPT